MAMQDFSGNCSELVMSCFVKAAILNGGTALAASAGVKTEDRERRRSTVVVWILTLLLVVTGRWGQEDEEIWRSIRYRDLETMRAAFGKDV
jgi:hypothetical protein